MSKGKSSSGLGVITFFPAGREKKGLVYSPLDADFSPYSSFSFELFVEHSAGGHITDRTTDGSYLRRQMRTEAIQTIEFRTFRVESHTQRGTLNRAAAQLLERGAYIPCDTKTYIIAGDGLDDQAYLYDCNGQAERLGLAKLRWQECLTAARSTQSNTKLKIVMYLKGQ